jgi:hypothetical protein
VTSVVVQRNLEVQEYLLSVYVGQEGSGDEHLGVLVSEEGN